MSTYKIIRKNKGVKSIVLGDNQTEKLSGLDTSGKFLLIEQDDEPGVKIPLHVHKNEDELFRVIEGEMKMTIDNNTFILKSGDTAFCPRGLPHSWEAIGNKRLKTILFVIPSGLEPMFKELSNLKEFPPDFSQVASIAKRYDIEFIN